MKNIIPSNLCGLNKQTKKFLSHWYHSEWFSGTGRVGVGEKTLETVWEVHTTSTPSPLAKVSHVVGKPTTLCIQKEKEIVWWTCSIVSAILHKLICSSKTNPWYKCIIFIENTDCDLSGRRYFHNVCKWTKHYEWLLPPYLKNA